MKDEARYIQVLRNLLLAAAWTTVLAPRTAAQFSSSIEGTVADSTGAAVPRAGVVLIDEGTRVTQRTTASEAGFFRFTELPPGSYRIEVNHPGFKTWIQKNIVLQGSDVRTVYPSVAVGEQSAKVEVTAQVDLLRPVLQRSHDL